MHELRTVIYRVITPNVIRDTEITRAHLSDRKRTARHPSRPVFATLFRPSSPNTRITSRAVIARAWR